MQRGFANILILLVIVAIAAVGTAYYFGFDHGFEKSAKTSTSSPATTTSNGKYKQITFSDKWIKHRPSCKLLANKIEISYPDDWVPKEVNDARSEEFQVCYVLFGYPVQPGLQDSVPGQLVQFRIHAFLEKERTLEQYTDTIKQQDPKPIKVSEVMINNQAFTRFDFEKKCCANASDFFTSKGQIIFRIQTVNSHGYTGLNIDQYFELDPAVVESLNNEILSRIKFL